MDAYPLPPWIVVAPYIDAADPVEVHYVARMLGVSEANLHSAVRVAGPKLVDVRRLLAKFEIGPPGWY